MKGGLTAEEVKDVRAAWKHVLEANSGDLSSGLLLEYIFSLLLVFRKHWLSVSSMCALSVLTHIIIVQVVGEGAVGFFRAARASR